MGQLVDGTWAAGQRPIAPDGEFRRPVTVFRNWITPDGAPGPSGSGGFAAESGRYHLYVSYACPWAHRTLIFRVLKGLQPHIGLSVVHPDMLEDGWTLDTGFAGTTGDGLHGLPFLRDLYLRADPRMSGRVTVPVLWDSRRNTIVSNESAEIIRMFNSAFDGLTGNRDDYWPEPLRGEIEEVNALVYSGVNNGVYRAGFAQTQEAYDRAVTEVFATLDALEARLATRRWLLGDTLTEADWRLFCTLVRFDSVYHLHFKCNRRRIIDYPNLWSHTRALYQHPGVAGTVRMDHIVRHYHYSHDSLNPFRIIPVNPVLDFTAPHGR
jgi:glutathionyl-hydroquinone reductase